MASLSDEAGMERGIMKGDTISRSALIAEIKKWTTDCACIELIENEPTVDAVPIPCCECFEFNDGTCENEQDYE